MKVDLHLHSKFSRRPSSWVLKRLGCPESFSEPVSLERMTRRLGMGAMTLTDHNRIGGCLEIAHLPGVFISEEVTTYFPEDGCKAHVLVWDIDQAIHEDLQKLRENIYDLSAYLNAKGLPHAVAHPFYSINNRLTIGHIERFLLLFRLLEMNGTRDEAQNRLLEAIVSNLSPRLLEELADKHDLAPSHSEPWKKGLVGGSDDHSALYPARCHTEVPEAGSLPEFLEGLKNLTCLPRGRGSTPRTLAHNLYAIAYQFCKTRFRLERYARFDLLLRFLDQALEPEPRRHNWVLINKLGDFWGQRRRRKETGERFSGLIRRESERMIQEDPGLWDIVKNGGPQGLDRDDRWFQFVERVTDKTLAATGKRLLGQLAGANVFNIFDSLGAAGSLAFLTAPYFVSFGLYGRDRAFAAQVRQRFLGGGEAKPAEAKLALFTDTFHEVNGVARTYRQQAAQAALLGKDLTVVTCSAGEAPAMAGVKNFQPSAVQEMPEYPEQKISLPPFLSMLDHVFEAGYTHLHAATPGPLGLTALGIARVLNLPVIGTYHTSFPQYTGRLTGDSALEELTWRYILWFYEQMDAVYVPSRDTGEELMAKGLAPEKIRLYPRGVDTGRFHPAHRRPETAARLGLENREILLYVGRVSREKNLPLLVKAFRRVAAERPKASLLVVGGGPYLEEMRRECRNLPAVFTGYLEGQELSEAYAAADLFLFPSTTDTFGNAVLEAQASGVPVIVSDAGGPRENCLPGRTGLVVPADDAPALARAALELLTDPARRRAMGLAAREAMEARSFQEAFRGHWEMMAAEGTARTAAPGSAEKTEKVFRDLGESWLERSGLSRRAVNQ